MWTALQPQHELLLSLTVAAFASDPAK